MERTRKENDSHQSGTSRRVAQARTSQSSPQKDLASDIDNSPFMVAQRKKLQSLFGGAAQLQDEPISKPNNTGLPDNLKSGIESLSGMSMDHVKVHYNSSQPAQLNALAYAQGSDIHVAPGQEKHLPHEAWHVVQQAQGRVKPTMQMKGGVAVNDDKGLEHEADAMGARALQSAAREGRGRDELGARTNIESAQLKKVVSDRLNVAGEVHPESDKRRRPEYWYAHDVAKGGYWGEVEFEHGGELGDPPDLRAIYKVLRAVEYYALSFDEVVDFNKESDDGKKMLPDDGKKIELLELIWSRQGINYPQLLRNEVERMSGQTRAYWSDILNRYSEKFLSITYILEGMVAERQGNMVGLEIALGKMWTYVNNIKQDFDVGSSTEASINRTYRMCEVANKAVGKSGVWKVGENHVQDMKGKGLTCTFNLLTLDEFEAGFSEYCREQKTKSETKSEKKKKKKRRRSRSVDRQTSDRQIPEKKKRKRN